MQARHRTVLILLLALASAASPAIARQQSWWLAQVPPEAPEAVPLKAPVENVPPEDPAQDIPNDIPAAVEAPVDVPVDVPADSPPPAPQPLPTGEVPAELTPPFVLPESLPEGSALRIAGSSSMTVITNLLKQQFEARYPSATVTLAEQPADAAIQSLQSDEAEIVAIGRPLTEAEKASGLREIIVSRDKIALIVSAQNPFQGGLDAETFVQIFRGQITNWNQVGGPEDLPIRLIDRPDTSDIRTSLGNYAIFAGDLTTGSNAETVASDSTAAVVDALGRDGLGYAIASEVLEQDNVRVLSMSGTSPDDPRYPYSQTRRLVYQDNGTLPPEVEAFLAFATNPDGQAAIAAAKVAEAADVAVADLPKRVVAMRPNGEGFVTGDRQGNLNFWRADGSSVGSPEQRAHTGPITALAFSPDGQRLVSGGADGVIRLWDAVGNPIGEPINTAGQKPVTSLVIKADGSFISGSTDGSLQPWDDLGNPFGAAISAHTDTVTDIALASEGQSFVTASKDGTLRQWNMDGTPKGEPLVGHTGPVNSLAIKLDGNLVSGGADSVVRQWNADGTPVGETPVSGPITALATAPDGQIAVGSDNGDLQLLDSNSVPIGEPIAVNAPVDDVAFSPDGDRLIVSAGDTPEIRDATGQLLASPQAGETAGNWVDDLPLPPALTDSLRSLGNLPPQVIWLIPIAVIALLILGLLRSLREDEGEESDGDDVEVSGTLPMAADSADALADENFDDNFDDVALDTTPVSGFDLEIDNNVSARTDTFDDFDTVTTHDFQTADFGEADRFAGTSGFVDTPTATTPPVGTPSVETPRVEVPLAEASPAADPKLAKARQMMAQGVALAKANRHEDALDTFNRAIEATELERLKAAAAGVSLAGTAAIIAKSLAQRGTTLVNLGRLDEALKSLDHALEMEPGEITAWLGKGHLMAQKGRFDEALFCFDKAIALNPNLGAPWQGKGVALQNMGRTSEANACFAKAQSLGVTDGAIPVDVGAPIPVRNTSRITPVDAPAPTRDQSAASLDFAITPQDVPTDFQDVPDNRVEASNFGRPVPDDPEPERPPVGQPPATKSGVDFDAPSTASADLQTTLNELPITADTDVSASRMAPSTTPPQRTSRGPTTPTHGRAKSQPPTPTTDSFSQTLADLPDQASKSQSDDPKGQADAAPPPPSTDADVPPTVLEAIEGLPTATDIPEEQGSGAPPADIPPEVAAILAGTSDLPSAEDAVNPPIAISPRATTPRQQVTTAPVTQPPQPAPAPSKPVIFDPNSTNVPASVLEILQGLPDNTDNPESDATASSPTAPKKRPPPPPPSNPRLRKPSS